MARTKITAAFDMLFHEKIMDKYTKTKKNYSNFPMMIFIKNMGNLLANKINLDFLFRLIFHGHSMFTSLRSEKKVIKNFHYSHKNILMQYSTSLKTPLVNNKIYSFMKIANFMLEKGAYAFNSFYNLMFKPWHSSGISYYNRGFLFDKKNNYSSTNKDNSRMICFRINGIPGRKNFNDLSSQTNSIWLHNTFYQPDQYCLQRLNYTYILNNFNIQFQKNVLNDHHPLYYTKSHGIKSKHNLFQINNTFRNDFLSPDINGYFGRLQKQDFSDQSKISKFITFLTQKNSLNKSYNIISSNIPIFSGSRTIFAGHGVLELKSHAIFLKNNSLLNNRTLLFGDENSFNEIKQNNIFRDQDNFFFKNNQKLEQKIEQKIEKKIEQVKKIADELKNTVVQQSILGQDHKNGIDRHIDINRISDRVYQMIDQRIKIEKERRGYL